MKFAQTSRQPHLQPLVQSSVQPDIQKYHTDNPTKKHMPNPDSSLYALANLSVDLLNDIVHEGISTPLQDLNPDSKVSNVDFEVPTKEENPLWDRNQSPEPSQPPKLTVEQLTSELTQSMNQNEAYVKIISKLQ